jgi:hypothetical protein
MATGRGLTDCGWAAGRIAVVAERSGRRVGAARRKGREKQPGAGGLVGISTAVAAVNGRAAAPHFQQGFVVTANRGPLTRSRTQMLPRCRQTTSPPIRTRRPSLSAEASGLGKGGERYGYCRGREAGIRSRIPALPLQSLGVRDSALPQPAPPLAGIVSNPTQAALRGGLFSCPAV